MPCGRPTTIAAAITTLLASGAAARATDFEADVRPTLERHCVSCHGPERQQSLLRLDGQSRVLGGGLSGAVVAPGRSGESLLIQHLTGAARPRMPTRSSRSPRPRSP